MHIYDGRLNCPSAYAAIRRRSRPSPTCHCPTSPAVTDRCRSRTTRCGEPPHPPVSTRWASTSPTALIPVCRRSPAPSIRPDWSTPSPWSVPGDRAERHGRRPATGHTDGPGHRERRDGSGSRGGGGLRSVVSDPCTRRDVPHASDAPRAAGPGLGTHAPSVHATGIVRTTLTPGQVQRSDLRFDLPHPVGGEAVQCRRHPVKACHLGNGPTAQLTDADVARDRRA